MRKTDQETPSRPQTNEAKQEHSAIYKRALIDTPPPFVSLERWQRFMRTLDSMEETDQVIRLKEKARKFIEAKKAEKEGK